MNSDAFFQRHGLETNPFRAEEARQDIVFERIEGDCRHPDFEKIIGDLHRPSSSVVFGERGSGKTALRMQIEDEVVRSNGEQTEGRCLVIPYDEFNSMLGNLSEARGMLDPADVVPAITLTDHLDGVLSEAVPPLVEAAMSNKPMKSGPYSGVSDIRKRLRAASPQVQRDLQLLQVCYDQGEDAARRGDRLRRAMQFGSRARPGGYLVLAGISVLLAGGWAVAVGMGTIKGDWLAWLPSILALLACVLSFGWWARLRLGHARVAKRLARWIRISGRDSASYGHALSALSRSRLTELTWPSSDSEESRFRMLQRLLNVVAVIGYRGIIVLIDRVDEPVAINGDPDRMRAFIWPLFRNKVMQLPGVGFKFLLPIEVRDALYRESPEFFREARLDKQNMVERLGWSGAMLYDLCTARLRACSSHPEDANLMDLFDEGLARQDLVDALDQMQQPRDAFKMLYGLIQEHCSNVTTEQNAFTISRTVLDMVRKRQVERREGLIRGSRPA
ncbi:MAG: hypothetical protein MK085_09440 [Phycisphaerales bacterium]|nr:hypothetical protein [Phycisphaerales bacterium]